MKNEEKASISIVRIIVIAIILILLLSIGVMASNTQLNDVKIVLESGYEITTITDKYIVSEILAENNVILEENQKTIPDYDNEITSSGIIQIVDITYEEVEIANADVLELDELLASYESVTEKIVVEEVVIPFETTTRELSTTTTSSTTNSVVQEGVDGLKKLTYNVKYENGIEIEKTLLSEEIITEAIDKIIEVTIVETSRSLTAVRTGSGTWTYSEEEFDLLCAITAQECGSSYDGALAVITAACNRTESASWSSNGSDPLSQYKAEGQFCYSIDTNWKSKLNGNYASCVTLAVTDALNGVRNHTYLSFRSSSSTTISGVNIGGNVYFNSL